MNNNLLEYIFVGFASSILYNIIPASSNPIKDMWVFVIVSLMVFHYLKASGVKISLFEKFVAEKPSPIQEEIGRLEMQLKDLKKKEKAEKETVAKTTKPADCNCEKKIEDVLTKYLSKGKYIDEKGMIADMLNSDMQYNQLDAKLMQPLGSYDKSFTNKWDHSFTILNTDKWAVPARQAPVCKTEKKCPVCPSTTNGYPTSVLDFDDSRKVLGPDNINTNYVNKLNS